MLTDTPRLVRLIKAMHSKNSKVYKIFLSHRILRHMYEALNIDEKITYYTIYL